ncbi:MAG: amidohydrolase family protein [Lysobacterales bacterium]
MMGSDMLKSGGSACSEIAPQGFMSHRPCTLVGFLSIVLISLLITVAGCAGNPTGNSRAVAIINVTTIDPVNGKKDRQNVVFRGDTITHVQSVDDPLPPVSRRIDGDGKFLIPGLWDFHVHLTYTDGLTAAMPELFLKFGITSVRDTGGTLEKLLPVVNHLRTPGTRAPRVFFSGPLLDGPRVVYDGVGREELGTPVASADQARQIVKHLKDSGADFIKIYELVTPEIFHALVDAAREHKLPIESHVPLVMSARVSGALVDGIQHLRNIELDCASNAKALLDRRKEMVAGAGDASGFELRTAVRREQIAEAISNYDRARCLETMNALRNTLQAPTLRLNAFGLQPPYTRGDWQSALAQMPQPIRGEWDTYAQFQRANPRVRDLTATKFAMFLTGEMFRAGVPFAAGTDTPIGFAIPGYSLHRELELLREAGLPALEVLASATTRPAQFFSLESEMGLIQEGFRADLVLLNGNPLENISNTRNIHRVFSKGIALDP